MPSSEDNRNVRGGRRGGSVVSGRGRKDSSRGRHRYGNEHFSAGGCKSDPLNIRNVGSGDEMMPDEEIVREESEKPIEVFIPKNTRDPLNLNKLEKSRKKRKAQEERDGTMSPNPKKQSRTGSPRTSSPKPDSESVEAASEVATTLAEKKKNKKEYFNNRYCYGNFDRYYGTRLGPGQKDSRLNMLKKEWFERRSVLDIGCNVGFLTLSLAKDFSPRRILGIDIDEHLIGVARKNIRHYCDKDIEFNGKFPASFSNQFGPIANQPLSFSTKFPDNIWFRKENYVLENDELLETIEEEFDVILALSITKWIHLNFGDDGLRRFFRRAFRQLLPGGRFIIEPQPFESYRKRAKMTETLKANYEKIEFKPSEFEMFLLDQVGFERVEQLGTVSAKSKGFERPVDVYVKKAPKFMTRGGKVADKDTSKSSSDGAATS